MRDVSFGQYYPADSLIHRLDGRTKILLATIFIVSVFFCQSLVSFAFLLALTLMIVFISKIPLRVVLRSLRAIVFILIFTFIINIFLTKGEGEPINKIVLDDLKDSYSMGEKIGMCEVYLGDKKVGEVVLYSDRDVTKANFFDNLKYNMKSLFKKGI